MSVLGRLMGTGTIALALALGMADSAAAQGVTTAGIRGVIIREGGGPIEGAVLTLINVPKGTRQRVNSLNHGRYAFDNVEAGGPYTLEVRAIGFELASKTGIMLTLGQRYLQDIALKTSVVQLEEIAVTAAVNPLINSARTGPSGTVSDSAISRLPLLGRSFTGLLNANPQVVNNSIAGQNNRFNAIQIDGAVNNDVYGLSSGGTPGGTAGIKPISIEAMKEFQVLVAPYDVRQSGFTGGLVNAVTKSGTNTITGSMFAYFQNQDLVGKDTAGLKLTEFRIKQYGGTLGGPIIKNRLHFFVAADIQGRDQPFFGAEVIEPSTGITAAQADRVTDYFRTSWGFDPGTYAAPVLQQPNTNVFAKLTGQVSSNHMLELTYNYNDGYNDSFSRSARTRNDQDGFQLSNSGNQIANTTKALRGRWIGQMGRVSTEVIAGYQTVADARDLPNVRPLALVNPGSGNYIAAGGERFSHANTLDQNVMELTANASFGLGDHRITVGAHAEKFDFINVFWEARYGVWTFGSLDSMDLGLPNRYEIIVPGTNPAGPVADFTSSQIGGYLQDQWEPMPRLTLTFGLRFDVPSFQDQPTTNEALKANAALGNIDTSIIPSGNLLFAPRFGFNWDVSGTGKTFLRGGVGIFSGRPPFVWMGNNFTNTGQEQASLRCTTRATIPTFTMDVDQLPTACAGGAEAVPATPLIVYSAPDFKWQQALKYSVGVDHQMFWGLVGTLDFLYTKNLNTLYVNDVNLKEPTTKTSEGSGRTMYGTITGSGSSAAAVPSRISSSYLGIYKQTNVNAGYNYLLTAQLTKPFGDNVLMNVAYTYSRTKDLMGATSSRTQSNFQNTVIDGDLSNRNLRYSSFDVPHKLALSGSVNLPAAFVFSAIFYAYAGTPYAWTASSDINGDGFNNNDALYIPKSSSDITLVTSSGAAAPAADWDKLNQWLAAQPCVWEQRGQIMERGSCRNPWTRFLDVRVAKRINTFGSQAMEVTADVFNFLNLLNNDWGLNRSTSGFENPSNILSVGGWDAANNRPKYRVASAVPPLERVSVGGSRWRLQLGAKYVF